MGFNYPLQTGSPRPVIQHPLDLSQVSATLSNAFTNTKAVDSAFSSAVGSRKRLLEGEITKATKIRSWTTKITPDGSVISSQTLDGKLQGLAMKRYPDGRTLCCPVENGICHGSAIEKKPDGTITNFSFENGERKGKAIERQPDGSLIDFNYDKNKRNGPARMEASNGRVVTCTFKDDEIQGLIQMSVPELADIVFESLEKNISKKALLKIGDEDEYLIKCPPGEDPLTFYKGILASFRRINPKE